MIYNTIIQKAGTSAVDLLKKLEDHGTKLWPDGNGALTDEDVANLLNNLMNTMNDVMKLHGSSIDTSPFSGNKDDTFYGDDGGPTGTKDGIYSSGKSPDEIYYQVKNGERIKPDLEVHDHDFASKMTKGQSYSGDQLAEAFGSYQPTKKDVKDIIAALTKSFTAGDITGKSGGVMTTIGAITTFDTKIANQLTLYGTNITSYTTGKVKYIDMIQQMNGKIF